MPRYHPIIPAQLEWDDAIPRCTEHNDIYFSNEGGIEETQYVFIEGNKLPERWPDSAEFTIAETGFGTGLNFLCAVDQWIRYAPEDARLNFISVEKHPLTLNDLKKALTAHPTLKEFAEELFKHYPPLVHGLHQRELLNGRITLSLMLGDATEMYSDLNAKVDAWFLDGFAPSKNPAMWTEQLFKQIARLSKPQATFATFTAAGIVKRGLKSVGFEVKTQKGFGRKRDMLIGHYETPQHFHPEQPWFHYEGYTAKEKTALIIGGGLAGCTSAHALAKCGWQVTLIERHAELAQGASGNHSGVVMPRLTADMSPDGQFYLSAFLHTTHWLNELKQQDSTLSWHQSGVIQLATEKKIEKFKKLKLPDEVLQFVSAEEASEISGTKLRQPAFYFPMGGWLQPPQLCKWLIKDQQHNIKIITNTEAISLKQLENSWQVFDNNTCIAEACIVIVANGYDAEQLLGTDILKLQKVRGQIAYLPETEESKKLKTPVCYDGYIIPSYQRQHCTGATYAIEDETPERLEADDQEILQQLKQALPEFDARNIDSGRVAFRTSTQDHLPIAGPVPDIAFFDENYNDLYHGKAARNYPMAKYLEGLFVNTGHGSRGLVSCRAAIEILLNPNSSKLMTNITHSARTTIKQYRQTPHT